MSVIGETGPARRAAQAEALLCLQRPDDALKMAERGLEIRSTVLGARHVETGAALGLLASVLLQLAR